MFVCAQLLNKLIISSLSTTILSNNTEIILAEQKKFSINRVYLNSELAIAVCRRRVSQSWA